MHGQESLPQNIKIKSRNIDEKCVKKFYCPFRLMENFLAMRGSYISDSEKFFVFRDGSNVNHNHVCNTIRFMLTKLNLNSALYDTHSLRIGRSSDMLKYEYSIEEIKLAGRWKSNAVFWYLRKI